MSLEMMVKENTKVLILILFVLISFSSFYGCTQGQKENIVTCDDFIKVLSDDKGYVVSEIQPGKETPHTFFTVYAKRYNVNNEIVAVYEFENADITKSQAATISKDGNRIGGSFISWVGKPHFYMQGRIIVQYIGSSETLLEDLTAIFGNMIAGMD